MWITIAEDEVRVRWRGSSPPETFWRGRIFHIETNCKSSQNQLQGFWNLSLYNPVPWGPAEAGRREGAGMRPILAALSGGEEGAQPERLAKIDRGSRWGQKQGAGPIPRAQHHGSAFRLCPRAASTPLLRNCAPGPGLSRAQKSLSLSLTYTSIPPGAKRLSWSPRRPCCTSAWRQGAVTSRPTPLANAEAGHPCAAPGQVLGGSLKPPGWGQRTGSAYPGYCEWEAGDAKGEAEEGRLEGDISMLEWRWQRWRTSRSTSHPRPQGPCAGRASGQLLFLTRKEIPWGHGCVKGAYGLSHYREGKLIGKALVKFSSESKSCRDEGLSSKGLLRPLVHSLFTEGCPPLHITYLLFFLQKSLLMTYCPTSNCIPGWGGAQWLNPRRDLILRTDLSLYRILWDPKCSSSKK